MPGSNVLLFAFSTPSNDSIVCRLVAATASRRYLVNNGEKLTQFPNHQFVDLVAHPGGGKICL